MAFSMENVLNAVVEASTRKPHAVKPVAPAGTEELYVHEPWKRPGLDEMMGTGTRPDIRAARSKSDEQLEHDTLSRIRDALYREQQV